MTVVAVNPAELADQTADAYRTMLCHIVRLCDTYIEETGCEPGTFDLHGLYVPLRSYFHNEDFRPRERQTAAEFYRSALRTIVETMDEYADVCDLDSRFVDANDVIEEFIREVDRARRACDRDPSEFAPEDDTNPVKTVPVPVPDRSAEPINDLGVRQGDWVQTHGGERRQVLTGPNKYGRVRVSDPRDGGALFGGYHLRVEDVGRADRNPVCDPPSDS